jgi:hypothetical protein
MVSDSDAFDTVTPAAIPTSSQLAAAQPAFVLHKRVREQLGSGPATLLLELAAAGVWVAVRAGGRLLSRPRCGTMPWSRRPGVLGRASYSPPMPSLSPSGAGAAPEFPGSGGGEDGAGGSQVAVGWWLWRL